MQNIFNFNQNILLVIHCNCLIDMYRIIKRLHTYGEVVIEQSLSTPIACVLCLLLMAPLNTFTPQIRWQEAQRVFSFLLSQIHQASFEIYTNNDHICIFRNNTIYFAKLIKTKYKQDDIWLFFIKACTLKHNEKNKNKTSNKIAYQMHSIFS